MKKKMTVMLLAFCLVLSNGMLAFAAEEDAVPGGELNQSMEEQMLMEENEEGEEGQFVTEAGMIVYEAYTAYLHALDAKSMEDLQSAKDLLAIAGDFVPSMNEEELLTLFRMLPIDGENNMESSLCEYIASLVTMVEDFAMLAEAYEAYLEEATIETCEDFLSAEDAMETFAPAVDETLFSPFYGVSLEEALDEVFETCNDLEQAQQTNAKKVADAYEGLKNTFIYGGDAVIKTAVEQFPETLDLLDSLTDEELEELAGYLGVDSGKEAYELVYTRWESVQAFMEFPALYAAYKESGSVEAAAALTACYEKMEDAFVTEMLAGKYEDVETTIEESYNKVKAAEEAAKEEPITSEEEPAVEENESTQVTSGRGSAPETGDETGLLPFAVLFAAGAVLLAMRKSRA